MIRLIRILSLFLLFTGDYLFAQNNAISARLECSQLTGDVAYNELIVFEVQRIGDSIICYQVSLEKHLGNNWITYNADVFNPNSKGVITCAQTNEVHTYKFRISTPEFMAKSVDGNVTPSKSNSSKIGLFRLKVSYGATSDNLTEALYLPVFAVAEEKKK